MLLMKYTITHTNSLPVAVLQNKYATFKFTFFFLLLWYTGVFRERGRERDGK
jgi:hypothetical protein